jgi:pimeloyl-ACP methyl ester carboxylesterase
MGGAWPRRVGASSLAAGLVALLAGSAAAAPTRACPTRFSGDIRCLRVSVPLDRGGTLPGTIRLRVRIEPPELEHASGTILALAGGPGQAAAPLLEQIRFVLPSSALRTRRLVVFDQRGTGGSGRLRCPELAAVSGDALPSGPATQRAVAGCAKRLGPARAHYATADSVQDIEAVRGAIGVDRLVLYGTSYGTKVALDYAATYPQHVSRLLLDSVVLPEGVDAFERSTLAAIPTVMRALCDRHDCPFTRDGGADVAALGRRLAHGPIRGRMVDGRGRPRRAAAALSDLYPLLLTGDLLPMQRALVPAAVRSALDGDPALLLRLAAVPAGGLDTEGPDSDALFVATRCEDGAVPWAPGTPIDARAAAAAAALAAVPPPQLAPFGPAGVRELGFSDLCRSWPEAPVSQPRPPLPDIPTLILSGDQDLRTPRSDALALAARMPSARVVAVPLAGHSTLGSDPGFCAESAVAEFLAGREPRACRRRAPDFLVAPIGLPPRGLRTLRPVPGPPPHVGRTLVAVADTFEMLGRSVFVELLPRVAETDVRHVRAFRLGGLRAGSLTFTRRAAILRRYSVVPGVTLSGRITTGGDDDDAPTRMRVGGRAAARGLLRIGDRWISGRLGGHRVRVRAKLVTGAGGAAAARATAGALPGRPKLPPLPRPLRKLLGWT